MLKSNSILTQIKVLELEGLAPSVFTGMMLADFGADVTLIIEKGKSQVPVSIPIDKQQMNRGKKTIAFNLKDKQDRIEFESKLKESQVLIDPYRPGVLERLGYSFSNLQKINPRIILVRLTGYGQVGLYKDMAGHDINYLSMAGTLSFSTGSDKKPAFPANVLADFAAGGTYAFIGVLLAIISGQSTVVDVSITDCTTYLNSFIINAKANTPFFANPAGYNVLDGGSPFYKCYQTKDQKYIAVGCLEPKFYKNFINVLFHNNQQLKEHWQQNQFNIDEWPQMENDIQKQILTLTRDEWWNLFKQSDTCATPVLHLNEIKQYNPQVIIQKSKKEYDYFVKPQPKLYQQCEIGEMPQKPKL